MSHFTCLILNENVEEQLEPFYELECSMTQDKIKNDQRAEFIKEFTTEELKKDFINIRNEHPELYYESIEEFADRYHGYIKADNEELWGRWTNPNSKWDWYSIGGRWTGSLKIKKNPKYPDDIYVGKPGLMTIPAKDNYADSIRLCDIDFEGQKKDTIEKLENDWKEIEQGNIDFMYGVDKNETKESYIQKYSNFYTHAVIKDGKWYEKGEMGWFGITTNEDENWEEEFDKLIKSLPENTLLTIIDCHI